MQELQMADIYDMTEEQMVHYIGMDEARLAKYKAGVGAHTTLEICLRSEVVTRQNAKVNKALQALSGEHDITPLTQRDAVVEKILTLAASLKVK